MVAVIPFPLWRTRTGGRPGDKSDPAATGRLAASVERAANRLPFEVKCLPRALALSALLRRKGFAHRVVVAVRPAGARGQEDDLHAWVEVGETVVLGNLPGPWIEVLAMPARY